MSDKEEFISFAERTPLILSDIMRIFESVLLSCILMRTTEKVKNPVIIQYDERISREVLA